MAPKPVRFLGDSLKRLRGFPEVARRRAGQQLERLQHGLMPEDFKPMSTIGRGVQEIRVHDESGAYRVIYTARMAGAVYVLHAFRKKSERTAALDLEMARQRYLVLLRGPS
jgi:phage-related protein